MHASRRDKEAVHPSSYVRFCTERRLLATPVEDKLSEKRRVIGQRTRAELTRTAEARRPGTPNSCDISVTGTICDLRRETQSGAKNESAELT